MRWASRILFAGLVLVTGRVAAGAEVAAVGFGPPVYDGVVADPQAPNGSPRSYRFEGGRDWPAIRLRAPRPLDWTRAGALTIDVENPGAAAVRLLLRIDDRVDADGDDRSLTGTAEIAPHARRTLVLPLEDGPAGMRGRPPGTVATRPGEQVVTEARGHADLRHVVALHISGVRTDADHVLLLGAPVLRDRAPGPRPPAVLADRFGQSIAGDWPEKVGSLADLRAKLRAAESEVRRLAADPGPAADRFGGVDGGRPLHATGAFRTAKVNGRWSLVTPMGHRFFSLGVDTVAASNPTLVTGRGTLFEDLPPEAALADAYDFGTVDLARGLGPEWRTRWPLEVTGRLKAWGFNTFGNWSEPTVTDPGRMAHVLFTDVEGRSAMVPMTGGRALPDPFDPAFARVADEVASRMTAGPRADPSLLGYFSGNELPWGQDDRPEDGVAAHVLALGRDSPAKAAFVADLRARYVSETALDASWAMAPIGSWDEILDRPLILSPGLGAAARADIKAFEARFAEAYFRTVALALRARDPNHLYLGTRFGTFTAAAVGACARWCDVLSFNVYGTSPEVEAEAWRPYDKPVLIGEFHFGSTDRGSFWPGMVAVGSEDQRGPAYAAYVSAALTDPQIVGTHWYQYADEPLTGRPYDGENGHIGLVAVTNVPYGGFVAAVAAANRATMAQFAASGRPELRGTEEP